MTQTYKYPIPKHSEKVLFIRLERWGDLISWFEKMVVARG